MRYGPHCCWLADSFTFTLTKPICIKPNIPNDTQMPAYKWNSSTAKGYFEAGNIKTALTLPWQIVESLYDPFARKECPTEAVHSNSSQAVSFGPPPK